jgi:hypothetical protein
VFRRPRFLAAAVLVWLACHPLPEPGSTEPEPPQGTRASALEQSTLPTTAGQPSQLDNGVPPDTVITSAPPRAINQPNATFTFTSEPGNSFECSLDGEAFSPCSSPATYSNLAEGQHTFRVLTRDVVGNVDPFPASHS